MLVVSSTAWRVSPHPYKHTHTYTPCLIHTCRPMLVVSSTAWRVSPHPYKHTHTYTPCLIHTCRPMLVVSSTAWRVSRTRTTPIQTHPHLHTLSNPYLQAYVGGQQHSSTGQLHIDVGFMQEGQLHGSSVHLTQQQPDGERTATIWKTRWRVSASSAEVSTTARTQGSGWKGGGGGGVQR